MGKGGGQKQTTTQTLDPATQKYVGQMRDAGRGANQVSLNGPWATGPITQDQIGAAMNPYLQNVIGGVRGEFDHLRDLASRDANQMATQAGAFGGSRHAVMEGARLGALDRAQASQIGGLLNQGYGQALNFAEHQRGLQQQANMDPFTRRMAGLQAMNLGMGPVGFGQTSSGGGSNVLGSAAGGAMAGSAFGPWGAAIGGGIGLLGGLF